MRMKQILAAMDIGTNSVRLAVVQVGAGHTWTTLANQKQVVRLGEGEFETEGKKRKKGDEDARVSRLTEAAIARGALVCARFAEVARGFGAEEIIALATAAVREAENRDEFVDRVRDLSDLDVRVISGQEEARLIYLGVSSGVDIPAGQRALFMDIGGGSTELIVGDGQEHVFLDSLRNGAIRLTAEFVRNPKEPIPAAVWAQMQKQVRSMLAPAARAIAKAGFSAMYGSSGTAQNIAEIAAHIGPAPFPTSFRNYALTLDGAQNVMRRLCALPIEQRRRVPGINPERADIIIGGGCILQTVMETVGAASLRISDRGLREGIIIDRLRRDDVPAPATADALSLPAAGRKKKGGRLSAPAERETSSARLRSIKQLMEATHVDESHAAHIVRLSLSLFDQWKTLGLHVYGRARELLEYAALLHDAGFFVSHTDHQQHSYYLIRHSELLGFNDREVEIIASVALYHRKALPRKKHAHFAGLDGKTQRLIQVLSCALRLAEALDRSHLMLVQSVECEMQGNPSRMTLTLHATADAQLEVWAAQAQASAFEKTFGLLLEVRVAEIAGGEQTARPARF